MKLVKIVRKERTKIRSSLRSMYQYTTKNMFYFVMSKKEIYSILDKYISKEHRFFMYDTGEVDMSVHFKMADGTLRAFMDEQVPIITTNEFKLLQGKCQHCGSENCGFDKNRKLTATQWNVYCKICGLVVRKEKLK